MIAWNKIDERYYQTILILSGALFFIPLLGYVHLFDWDEINFAESAREMLLTGEYFQVQINFTPFEEKPPLFFWLQSLSMSLFGVNEFSARLPNALFGILTLITLYKMGKELISPKFGFMWALVYFGSFLPHFYYKSGIIDPVFNYFIFASVYMLTKCVANEVIREKRKFALLSGVFIGLATITKGPVGILLLLFSFLGFWGAKKKFKKITTWKEVALLALGAVIVTFLAFGIDVVQNGPERLINFVLYQIELLSEPVAGHDQPIYYHFVVVLIGCFPMSIYAFEELVTREIKPTKFTFKPWMQSLFWVVLILFTVVTTKIVHYSSMTYLPLSFLATWSLYKIHKNKTVPKKWISSCFLGFGILFSVLLIAGPIILMNKEWLYGTVKDITFVRSLKTTELVWSGWEFGVGMLYLGVVIYGWMQLRLANTFKAVTIVSYGTAICLFLTAVSLVKNIERLSQGGAIAFYERFAGQDVYIKSLHHKSYAQHFYFQRPFTETAKRDNSDWLLNGPIDKPAYFVSKVKDKENISIEHSDLKLIDEKGGYLLWQRLPKDY